MSKKVKDTLIIQGIILAIAGIITKIIGFIYRIPMANLLGAQGNGVYSVAFGIYNIALTLSSYSLPLTVSKLVSYRLAKKEYKNSYRAFLDALCLAVLVGSIACFVLFAGANGLEIMYNREGLARPLRVLAPTTFVVALLGVMRGYFQGNSNMIPTAISQIIEQLVNAVVSVVATYQFMRMNAGAKDIASYGAAGGTLGTLVGAITALVFMIILFLYQKNSIKTQIQTDDSIVESRQHILRALFYTAIPVILSQTVYQIGYTIDDFVFGNIMIRKGISDFTVSSLQGVFNTQYNQLVNLPVAVATAMAATTIPTIVILSVSEEFSKLNKKISMVVKLNMAIAFPAAIGLSVLSKPIMTVLFPALIDYQDLASNLLLFGSSAVVFYALSTITTAILQGCNYMRIPLMHAGISLVIHIMLVSLLLLFTDLSVYALLIGNVTFPLLICILNCRAITKHLNYQWDLKRTFGIPFLASVFMGIFVFASYYVVFLVSKRTLVSLILAVLLGIAIYFFLLVKFNCFTNEEMEEIPLVSKFIKK